MNNYTGYTTTNFDYAMESGIHADNERLTDPAFHDAQRTIDREQARDIMFWLRDGVPTAMNMFQETMRTATLATGDHPPEPTIFIEDDNYLSVQYRPTRAIVSLSSLQIAAQDLLVKCRVQLEEHVLRGYRLPVPFTSTSCNIVDQQASEDPSVDFFTASGNPTADPAYLTALMFHLATQYSDEFISHVAPNSTLVWKLDSLYRWLNQARKLIMMIMVLVHITSGQPARGEELAATTIRCTALGAKRGMYWYRGKIMLVQYYYKRRSRGTADRYIARFLTRELSDILLHYLVLVRPFERVFGNAQW
ncbi:hypothetical protein BDB00DRAFT_283786 [Zychaea mexicana]|uniref:uncharacterized protein n=1 Tax=Zychaea mexicana TaxID=64656 RepID=UPI0022FE7C26|nr:uncharacterized protein BDB00DRAFT_283786 [Zychaea mexicana]KAI9468310.1 hypothetical protein BDB00DRAFT_283786 [Zychaea mexicana]